MLNPLNCFLLSVINGISVVVISTRFLSRIKCVYSIETFKIVLEAKTLHKNESQYLTSKNRVFDICNDICHIFIKTFFLANYCKKDDKNCAKVCLDIRFFTPKSLIPDDSNLTEKRFWHPKLPKLPKRYQILDFYP